MDVEDPFAINHGDKIRVLRSTRDDPLADHHARRHIDDAQYAAGREFQQDFERAERGPRAVELKEWVDGGLMPEPLTEWQRKAVKRLSMAYRELGMIGSTLAHDVLIHNRTMIQVVKSRGLEGRKYEEFFAMRFRECLDCLAFVYGFANEKSGRRRLSVDNSAN